MAIELLAPRSEAPLANTRSGASMGRFPIARKHGMCHIAPASRASCVDFISAPGDPVFDDYFSTSCLLRCQKSHTHAFKGAGFEEVSWFYGRALFANPSDGARHPFPNPITLRTLFPSVFNSRTNS